MTTEKKEHLNNVLQTHRMAHIQELLSKYESRRTEVKEKIEQQYKGKIYTPFNSGSYAKYTAINSKFDLDLVIPFKRDSFSTLEEMFNDLYDFLYEEYNTVASLRKQKVSVGIEFFEDENNDVINIDLVPGRELNLESYIEDNKLNLYINSTYGILESKSYIQTNIQAQIDTIKGLNNERSIIRLLKIWKITNKEKYKSFLFELITIKAFYQNDISGNLWEKLKSVMEYIRDNVANESFTLKDPGNSNNDVISTLDMWERQLLSSKMKSIIERIESYDENIKLYFPINKDFEEEEKDNNDSSYGIKDPKIVPSTPPNNQRFG